MKILLISWYFPPANDIGAIRIARLAEFLRDHGHDVQVLTGDRASQDKSLSTNFPESQVSRTPWFDVNTLFRFSRTEETITAPTQPGGPSAKRQATPAWFGGRLKSALTDIYVNLTWIPDHQIGWIPYVKRAGAKVLARGKFDLIYASGPPFSAFVTARSLSRRFGVPWIAEYRDAWSRYLYNPKPAWREFIDGAIESRVTSTASAIVGISAPWAQYYEERFRKPTLAVYNGIDRGDVIASVGAPDVGGALRITYVGAMYGGLRDPSALYGAIKRLQLAPSELQVNYYGPDTSEILPLAEKFGVARFVALHHRVSHSKSLEIQRTSDILLLLQAPGDPRNVPAKFFEYLAARRPILGLGLDEGIPASLIRQRKAGFYNSEPNAVASQLALWIKDKTETGSIPDLPESVGEGLWREEQFQELELFLKSLTGGSPRGSENQNSSNRSANGQ